MLEQINNVPPDAARPIDLELANRADAVIKFVAGYGIETGWGKYGESWAAEFNPTSGKYSRVYKDPKEFLTGRSEAHILGKAAHEGGHVARSRMEHYMHFWNQRGGSFIVNAWRDAKNNEETMANMPGVRDNFIAYLEDDFSPGGNLDLGQIQQDSRNSLGYVPSYVKTGSEMLNYWHKRTKGLVADPQSAAYNQQLSEFLEHIKDDDAKKVVQQSITDFEEYYHTYPMGFDENLIQESERKGAEILGRVWPAYEELVKKSYEDHPVAKKLQEMLEQMQQQQQDQQSAGKGQGKEEQSGQSGKQNTPLSELPQEAQEEILEKLQEEIEEAQKESQRKQEEKEDGKPSQTGEKKEGEKKEQEKDKGTDGKASPQVGNQGKGDGGEEQKQPGKPQDGEDSGKEPGSKKEGESAPKSQPNPWSKLSEKTKQVLRDKFKQELDKLPEEEQKKIIEQAEKELEDLEDRSNDKLQLKNNRDNAESNQQKREREKKEQSDQKEQQSQAEKQDAKEFTQKLDDSTEEVISKLDKNHYHERKNDRGIKRILGTVRKSLRRAFKLNDDMGIAYTDSGYDSDIARVIEYEADRKNLDMFIDQGEFQSINYRFTLMVDLSGSMLDSDKISKVFDVVVVFSEIMKMMPGIEFEIVGFGETLHPQLKELEKYITVYKKFNEPLIGKTEMSIGKLMEDCRANQGTPTPEATVAAWLKTKQRNKQKSAPFNAIIDLTDGVPTSYSSDGRLPEQYLKDTLRTLQEKDKNILLAGFGIGSGTDFVNDVYPRLPLVTRRKVAKLLHTDPESVGNSYADLDIFMKAFAIIIHDMIYYPSEYKKFNFKP